jgi:hypothetical protein
MSVACMCVLLWHELSVLWHCMHELTTIKIAVFTDKIWPWLHEYIWAGTWPSNARSKWLLA